MTTDDDGLTAEERRAFDGLPREQEPPAALEERTVAAVKAAGLIMTPGARRWSPGRYAAAAVVLMSCVAIGFAAGTWTAGTPVSQQPDYVLLLRASAEERQPVTDTEMQERITEYGSWARDLAQRGKLLAGEKLESRGWLQADNSAPVPNAGIAEGSIQGYFLIKSTSYDDAVRIAKSCPHVRHGGSIEVRRIERL